MKNVKRLLSIVLSLAMLLTMATFPALAGDYTYEPKTVVLEGSDEWWKNNWTGGHSGLNRPTNDFYVGDKLAFDGTTMGKKPTVTVDGTEYDIVAFRFDYDYKLSGHAGYLGNQKYVGVETVDGVTYLTGFYNTADEAAKKTGSKNPITLNAVGKIGAGYAAAYYYNAEGTLTTYWCGAFDSTTGIDKNFLWFIDVKAAPTTKDYQAVAPEKLPGIANNTTDLKLADFVADPADTVNFDVAKNNLFYLVKVMGTTTSFTTEPKAYNFAEFCSFDEGFRMDFKSDKVFVGTIQIQAEPTKLRYDVFGSMDGENWYPLVLDGLSEGSTTHNIVVNGIAKYFRFDIRSTPFIYNWFTGPDGIVLKSVDVYENVPEAWTVTVDGLTEGTYTTDVNGKVDLSELLEQFPASEYAYMVDGENVTDEIVAGTYAFAGNKTLVVTLKPKTVTLQPKKADSGLDWNNYYNGPIVAPREVIYVGDTVEFHLDDFDSVPGVTVNTTAGKVLYPVHKIRMNVHRYAMTDTDTAESFLGTWGTTGTDFSFVVTSPGVYQINVSNVYYYGADGTEVDYAFSHGCYNGVFEVLEAPTDPVEAPAYSGTGAVAAILDTANGTDITDTSIAFKKSYGRSTAYAVGGEGVSVLPINTAMAHPNDSILNHPTSQTLYLQFNLPSTSYVENVKVSDSGIYDYDTYGSTDGENWYLLNSGIVSSNTFNVKGVAKYVRIVSRGTTGWAATISGYSVNGYEVGPWTVTITDGKDYNKTVETDISGNFDYSDLTTKYPTSEFAYFVGEENITDAIVAGTYRANGDVTINIGYDYKEKTVGIPASGNNRLYCGPLFISRPTNDFYVGDMLTILEGTKVIESVEKCSTLAYFPINIVDPDGQILSKYVKVDAEGNYSGLYDTKDGTETSPLVLNKEGKWGFTVTAAYDANGTNLVQTSYFEPFSIKTDGGYRNINQCGVRFFIDVKATPLTKDYEAKAPTVIAGLASQSAALNINTTDKTKVWISEPNILQGSFDIETKTFASGTSVRAYADSVNLALDAETYVDSFVFVNTDSRTVTYDVFGSIDGENWYAISTDNTTSVKNNTVKVGAIVKYIRVDLRDFFYHWGESAWGISDVIGVEAVYSWNVTFTDGKTTKTVKTDAKGFYKVPEEFKVDFNYYSDANYTTKLNTAIPAKGNITVYVKANVWEYTPKTVYFQQRVNADSPWAYTNAFIKAPKVTIYVGDTITAPSDIFDGIQKDGFDVIGIYATITKILDSESDTKVSVDLNWNYGNEGKWDSYTFKTAGTYRLLLNYPTYFDADGAVKYPWQNPAMISCVFTVKEAPTTKPEAVKAPVLADGTTGVVTALLADNFDVTKAYRYTYGLASHHDKATTYIPETLRVRALNESFAWNTEAGSYAVTEYVQFNLDDLSYVTTINVTGMIEMCDIYGSTDGTNWYPIAINSVVTNDVNVNAVAKHIRLTRFDTSTWCIGSMVTKYSVNGYVVGKTAIDENAGPSWVAADGTKKEIKDGEELPVAYATADKNYAVTGWQMVTEAGLIDVSVKDLANMTVEQLGDLHAVVTEIPVAASALTATLKPKGADEGKTFDASKYINGFYVEGAQIRVPSGEGVTAVKSGLRFVNLLDNALITKLNELKTEGEVASYEYGTVVVADTKYTGGDLVIGYNSATKTVKGEKLFADAGDFEDAYFKYTVCVTNIGEANYATDVIVRPYITINNADGTSVTLYGEQYKTSVYSAAKFAIDNDANLTAEESVYLEGIVNVVEG